MAKLHGAVFIGIGLLFSITSAAVNASQNSNSLTIFIYVGYLFLAIHRIGRSRKGRGAS